jgi:hypothetical protein
MANTKRPGSVSSEKPAAGITIVVSYAWTAKSVQSDKKWKELRDLLKGVGKEAAKRATKLDPACALRISVARLRARHGMQVLDAIMARINAADVFVADVVDHTGGGCRANVMIELGMAIAASHGARGSLFIMKPTDLPAPSDLQGILLTEYAKKGDVLKLSDNRGFRSALRSRLLQIGYEKGLIRPSGSTFFEDADDD